MWGDDTTGVVVEVDDDGVDTTTLLVGDIATLEELGITTLLEVDVTMLLVELVVTVVAGVVDGILEELRIGEDDTTNAAGCHHGRRRLDDRAAG